MKTEFVSVVIPTYNRARMLKRCLQSLCNQNYPLNRYEIIVVDDGSTDNTTKIIAKFKPVRLIYIRQNRKGPAIARNKGIKVAKGSIILFIDDDSIADKNLIREIIMSFTGEDVGGVKGRVEPIYDDKNSLCYLLGKNIYLSEYSLATNNIAYRRDVLNEVGLFDESFPVPSWEDVDLGMRVLDLGYKIIYNPNAVVWHKHENSLPVFKKKAYINGVGLAHYSKKWLFRKPTRSLLALYNDTKLAVYYPLFKMVKFESMRLKQRVKFIKSMRAYYTLIGFCHGLILKNRALMSKYEQ